MGRRVLALAAWWILAAAPAASAEPVEAVELVTIPVSDLEQALDFYTRVLPFEKAFEVELAGDDQDRLAGVFGLRMRVARLRLGDEQIELAECLAPEGRPVPVDSQSDDRWFQHVALIVSDMDVAYRRLREHRVRHASTGPQRLPDWNPNAGGIRAFYFKDPDGHPLEILEFPEGKGDAKWRSKPSDAVFLGIDHTAIVVDDTERSLAFYRDALGLRVAGTSENWGPEQEHLNHVFGARLRITTLRAPEGPGIEFLEYLSPSDGRPYPPDSRACDLWQWQTRLRARTPPRIVEAIRAAKSPFLSPGLVELATNGLGFRKGFLVRDPDGHAVQVVSP